MKNRKSGFSLIELLVGLALSGTVMALVGGGLYSFYQKKSFVDLDKSLNQIRNEIIATLKQPDSLNLIKAGNAAAFDCLATAHNCSGVRDLALDLFFKNSAGTAVPVIWTKNDLTTGIDIYGRQCATFDAINGIKTCPFKWKATWDAICDANPCPSPTILVRVSLLYSSNKPLNGSNLVFNEKKFEFVIPFRQEVADTAELCKSYGLTATWDPVAKKCNLGAADNQGCPTGQYMSGMDQHGVAKCIDYPPTNCGAGQVISKINQDGTAVCRVPTCP